MVVTNHNKGNTINVLSLFSGCGGLDLGFEGDFSVIEEAVNYSINPEWKTYPAKKGWVNLPKNNFNTIFANDIREGAEASWVNYFKKYDKSNEKYHLCSIVDLVKNHKKGKHIIPKNVDVVTGGFPCQDFSVSGKRLGFKSNKSHNGMLSELNDPNTENRGKLYIWMREVIDIAKPNIFIAENVKGLVNLKDAKDIIENDFRKVAGNGYLVIDARVLHSADYGVAQSRERVIFIGFKKSALTKEALRELSKPVIPAYFDPYPLPTHAYKAEGEKLLPPTNLKQAFKGLVEPEESDDVSQQKYSKAKYMGKKCQGQSEVNLQGIGPTIRSEHHGNIEFRRLSREHGGVNYLELRKGLKERRLTIRECARVQSFPDDYMFVIPSLNGKRNVSASEAYKLIGNAVPPLLGYHIARRLQEKWSLYFGEKK